MGKEALRKMIESAAAIAFGFVVVSQLTQEIPMSKEQITVTNSKIENLKRQIEQISGGLPYADGRQYFIDKARIDELRSEIAALESEKYGNKD